MAKQLEPINLRDFSKGRIAKSAVNNSLTPLNSVANAINIDFSEIIGAGIVRKGKQTRQAINQSVSDGQFFKPSPTTNRISIYGTTRGAQTFTPIAGQEVMLGVTLRLFKFGLPSGDFRVELQAVTAGLPNGTIINGNSFVFNANTLAFTDANYNFTFNPGTVLTVSTQYAIVLSYPSGALTTDFIGWTWDSGGTYPGGQALSTVIIGAAAVQVLVVAGGGGGGNGQTGGGGGAGGLLYDATFSIVPGSYPVTIGTGGYGGQGVGTGIGANGTDSTFSTIVATGGGYGGAGSGSVTPAGNGGSGGGSGGTPGSPVTGGNGTSGQGNTGGGSSNGPAGGGGGGGAGAVGGSASSATAGAGGAGLSNSITGAAVFYAGGGAGAGALGGGASSQPGGVGGGGAGAANTGNGIAGTDGLGGGGGGGSAYPFLGGAGGKGVVIVAYKTDGSDGISPTSTGGSITTSGLYTIHTFANDGVFKAISSVAPTWSTAIGGDFYFAELIMGTVANAVPLLNFSFLINGVAKNVLAYSSPTSGGTIYYYNTGTNTWLVSNLTTLNALAKIRSAVLDGSVFEANGIDPMHDSADFGQTWGTTNSIASGPIPSLLYVIKNRMVASGWSVYPSRIYFSSIVVPSNSPFITWNTNTVNGDWIDVNPDDGGIITGFSDASSMLLVFKNNAMYRLNTINKTVDTENIFNVGAVSQEGIVKCLGLTYFYSGNGIYSTDGTFPQQISRIGVQDFVDAISNPLDVFAGTDGFNVYFSIGDITLTFGNEDTRTFRNVVLKYSPRDQSWTVYVYNQHLGQYSLFGVPPLVTLIDTQFNGVLATINSPIISDEGAAIPYDIETQELEMTSRSHTKQISDNIVVYMKNGGEGAFLVKENDGNFKPVILTLNDRVNIGGDINFTAQFFTFRVQGEAKGYRPIIEGIVLPSVTDMGIVKI